MNTKSSKFFFNWLQIYTSKQKIKGFTLIELLVAIAIGGIAIAGLLSIVTNLLQTDQRDAARSETQQQTQMAFDYISEELREAIYVYDGRCFQAGGQPSACTYIAGIAAGYINNPDVNSVPILAFWKLRPFPAVVQAQCAAGTPPTTGTPPTPVINCSSGRSYSLVVYYLRQNLPSDVPQWQGLARITRYELTQFDNAGNQIQGYVDPSTLGTSFQSWPQVNGQPLPTPPTVTPFTNVLADSIDLATSSTLNTNSCSNPANLNPPPNPSPYITSPSTGITSFYACVRTTANQAGVNQLGTSQDVWLYLTANASGKSGLNNNLYRPTLNTDVTIRGITNKVPF